ncbi:TonB-dependent receptor [Aquamicrobium sp. LC103]|uniref:TonB-dependent receptor domain-containing protein n=1 Tax=Aquamicrobium sp. LC103 TaxID=1120658 RepID=UPI00063E8B4E|nr:TonB-dependent receptor [Aquamicrobium sp. LC103]TKT79129.1 TonB-dependent receptor [Aquamicrobium sp. LC103]
MGLVARNSTVLLGGAAIAIVAGTMQVSAQDAATGEAVTNEQDKQGRVTLLQRIVVGAGVEKVAIDTPQSVSVVEQEDIDLEQATTVGDVLRGIPGVNTVGSDRVFGQGFNIRGIGAPEAAGEEGRIIVTVDGANKYYEQYRMGGLFTDPELFKRVEVLRGPASSTLYGSGALGGVINFTTKDAADFIADGANGAVRLKGSFNDNKNGWLGSALVAHRFSERFDFLLAGNYRSADPYVTGNGTEIASSNFEAWSGLAKATMKVGEEGTLRASYQQWDSQADDQDYAQIGGPLSGGSVSGFGTVDRHVIDRTAVLSYENPFSDNDMLNVKASASYSRTSVEQTNATGIPSMGFVCGVPGAETFCDADYAYETWQFNLENTSEWRGDNWENFLTYGWQTAYQVRSAEAFDPLGNPFNHPHHPEGTDLKTGLFVQNEFIWDDRLTLIPGIRVDWRRLKPDETTGLSDSTDDWAVSPKIAAHYKFNDNFAVFGSIAHTERFPTLDEVFSTTFAPSYGLKKEKSNSYEAGFAVSAFDLVQPGDGIQFKTTGFYNDISDLIVSCRTAARLCGPDGSYFEHYMNIDAARIYGAELELAYDSDYFFANASYTHTIGKNKDTGDYLTSVAPHELAFTLGGKVPQHDLKFGWKARFVSGPQDKARRSSEADWASSSTRFAKAFDVHDVFVSWTPQEGRFRGWEVIGGVDNIFDTQYKEFLHNEASKGRTFKITLSKQFDY